jgi:aldehyde dehydrogenase (NAD+)
MKKTVDSQRAYFNNGDTKSIKFRIEKLKELKKLLLGNEQELFDAIFKDFKKSEFDTYSTELSLVYHDIDEACKKLSTWSKTRRVGTNLINLPAKSYIIPEPLGVCLVIGAWNYPYMLSLTPLVAAVAAGNTVILKPSELPKHTSVVMADLINNAFDPSFIKVIQGGVTETTELLKQKFDKIFFTGSVPVGKIVYKAAAENLTPVTLELGGKSPAIVAKDCNLKMTVKRLVWAKFLNAGQTCISPDYVLVDKRIQEQFLTLVKNEIENQNFSTENGNYVQIINDMNLQRLVTLIDQEKVVVGGDYDELKRTISPTVMTNITNEDDVMKDEIFGPILPVISYTKLDQAIASVNERLKPLACYVFSQSRKTQKKVLNEISFGGGSVNEAVMHITNSKMPFGGVGSSGMGAYHGEYGFKTFSHYKSILDKPTWFEINLKYYPQTVKKLKLIKLILGQR